MAGRAPRDKGKRGELIVVHVLQEAGIAAQRCCVVGDIIPTPRRTDRDPAEEKRI